MYNKQQRFILTVLDYDKPFNNREQNTNFDRSADNSVSTLEEPYKDLIDYLEYLADPAAWFVEKEHPSFDGA